MKFPAVARYNPSPEYIRGLFVALKKLGRSRVSVCKQIGVKERTMGDYLNPNLQTVVDYPTQFAIEAVLAWEQKAMVGDWVKPDSLLSYQVSVFNQRTKEKSDGTTRKDRQASGKGNHNEGAGRLGEPKPKAGTRRASV